MTIYPYFDTTSLFAGEKQPVHRAVTVAQNGPLKRGTVLGRQTAGGAMAGVKASGANTGTGTLTMDGTAPTLANYQPGVYQVRFTSATAFRVTDPKGDVLGDGVNGTAFADQIKFLVAAGGTAFAAGDGFDITIAVPDKYVISKASAIDGSQIPSAIVAYDIDTTLSDVTGPCYFEGEFALELCVFDLSWTADSIRAAMRQNNIPLFLRSVGVLG